MATSYDDVFGRSPLGSCMRRAVWKRLDDLFEPGMSILELNCGTGEDALFLARRGLSVTATDLSPKMLQQARRKTLEAGLESRVEVLQADLSRLSQVDALRGRRFQGLLSNMGGLNCLSGWSDLAGDLAPLMDPGSPALFCVMGPLALWEWIGFTLQGRPSQAARRLHPGGVAWKGLHIRYPSPRRLRSAFRPYFKATRLSAIGVLLPPPLVGEEWARRHPRLVKTLEGWERRWETLFPLPHLADHYLLELERTRT